VKAFHLTILLIVICWTITFAQHGITLSIRPLFSNSPLHLDSLYTSDKKDTVIIEALRFYISSIELMNNDRAVWKEMNSYHLIDASEASSLAITLSSPPNIAYNKIKFNLGIDSSTNVSGALGGALDPTRGMYWTWQSGYINLKLEGKSKLCKNRNNEFAFHLGGYNGTYNALQTVILNVAAKEKINISFDVATFFSTVDLASLNNIMSPGKEAVALANQISKLFTTDQQ
jgi:hypothetical protein